MVLPATIFFLYLLVVIVLVIYGVWTGQLPESENGFKHFQVIKICLEMKIDFPTK